MKKMTLVVVLGLLVFGLSGFAAQGGVCGFFNPVKIVVLLLDFKLDLTDAQKKDIKGILEPFFAEMKAEHKKALANPEEMIEKVRSGKLEKADIMQHMIKKREFMAAQQDKVADTILKVYQLLTPEQRETLVSCIKGHLDHLMK